VPARLTSSLPPAEPLHSPSTPTVSTVWLFISARRAQDSTRGGNASHWCEEPVDPHSNLVHKRGDQAIRGWNLALKSLNHFRDCQSVDLATVFEEDKGWSAKYTDGTENGDVFFGKDADDLEDIRVLICGPLKEWAYQFAGLARCSPEIHQDEARCSGDGDSKETSVTCSI
jgi:hypothetical protein